MTAVTHTTVITMLFSSLCLRLSATPIKLWQYTWKRSFFIAVFSVCHDLAWIWNSTVFELHTVCSNKCFGLIVQTKCLSLNSTHKIVVYVGEFRVRFILKYLSLKKNLCFLSVFMNQVVYSVFSELSEKFNNIISLLSKWHTSLSLSGVWRSQIYDR